MRCELLAPEEYKLLLSPGCSPAKNQREDCVIPYIVDYSLRNHHILRPTPYWLTLNNSCQKTGI